MRMRSTTAEKSLQPTRSETPRSFAQRELERAASRYCPIVASYGGADLRSRTMVRIDISAAAFEAINERSEGPGVSPR